MADASSYTVDRSVIGVANLHDPGDEAEYWRSKTIEERLSALEFLREQVHAPDAEQGFRSVLEIARRERR